MANLEVSESIIINRAPSHVRSQFGDVAHHQAVGVHRGVDFVVVDDGDELCVYRQVTKVGPLRLEQRFELARTDCGPLINRIVAGQFVGGSITFDVTAADDVGAQSKVDAHFEVPLRGPLAVLAPLLRRSVRKALVRALDEDKADLESGSYVPLDLVPTEV